MIVTNCQIFSQLFVFPAFMHNPQLDLFNAEAEEDVINDQRSIFTSRCRQELYVGRAGGGQ